MAKEKKTGRSQENIITAIYLYQTRNNGQAMKVTICKGQIAEDRAS